MSDNNNGIIIAGLIVAYLYMKRRQAAGVSVVTVKAPATMPASVGSGTKQIAVGALNGLLQALASGPANNTSQTYFPQQQYSDTSGIAQEAVPDYPSGMDGLLTDELRYA